MNAQLCDVRGPRPRPQIKEKVYTLALSRKGTKEDSATRGKLGRPSTFTKEESARLFDMRDRQAPPCHPHPHPTHKPYPNPDPDPNPNPNPRPNPNP